MNKRIYNNNYPSVTQVLDGMRKIGLEMWFKYKSIQQINEITKRSLEIGTALHEAIQSHIEINTLRIETPYPDEITTAIKSFMLFKKDFPNIKLKKSEIQMTSEKYKFNGTLDCIGEEGKKIIILDWKSSEAKDKEKPTIYEEAKYQISAYVIAYNEIFNTDIQKAIIVSIAKDKIAYNKIDIGKDYINDSFQNIFLPMLTVWNFKKKEAVRN